MSALHGRVTRLEDALRRRRVCRRCYGHPYRVVLIDDATGETLEETFPEEGCPDCGAPVTREMQVMGRPGMELP